MVDVRLAVIGGSGVYGMADLEVLEERHVSTPFGDPSDAIVIGRLAGREIAFLPRHGRRHHINPTCLNARANIWALKSLGIDTIVSVSAVGSLKEELRPRDVVVPDQIIDRTKSRVNGFFDPIAVHVGFADPFCADLSALLAEAARSTGVTCHTGGTYVCMEGPLFSTRAESNLYRSWGASVIGMTALPEAKLAREAEICYATLAFVTDYDCWHIEDVTIDMVIGNLRANSANAQAMVRYIAANWSGAPKTCPCCSALETAVLTRVEDIPEDRKDAFRLLLAKYHQF